jgi:hypothetical protein
LVKAFIYCIAANEKCSPGSGEQHNFYTENYRKYIILLFVKYAKKEAKKACTEESRRVSFLALTCVKIFSYITV